MPNDSPMGDSLAHSFLFEMPHCEPPTKGVGINSPEHKKLGPPHVGSSAARNPMKVACAGDRTVSTLRQQIATRIPARSPVGTSLLRQSLHTQQASSGDQPGPEDRKQ